MGDYPGLRISDQAHAGGLGATVDAIRWDSMAAGETVQRICREAALRCQQVMARYAAVDIPDVGGHNRSDH
jgi:hypothetical protein